MSHRRDTLDRDHVRQLRGLSHVIEALKPLRPDERRWAAHEALEWCKMNDGRKAKKRAAGKAGVK